MTLDDLIRAADPARSRAFSGGTAADAARLIDEIEANQPSAPSRRHVWPGWLRRIGSFLAPAGALGATALVVIIAVLYAHPAQTRRPAPASGSRPEARGGAKIVALGTDAVVVRALRAELGILRQPQTPAAKAFNVAPKFGVRLARQVPYMPALTRAVKLPHKIVLYLYVAQRRELRAAHITKSYRAPAGLGMVLRAPYQGFGDCCIQPRALHTPVGPQATPYTMSQKPTWLYVELVPDGVTTVRWTFPAAAINARRNRNVTVRVHDNVAALTLPHAGAGNSGNTRSDAWYGPNGRLIARHSG